MSASPCPQAQSGERTAPRAAPLRGGLAGLVASVGSFAWLEWKTLRYYPSNLLLSLNEGRPVSPDQPVLFDFATTVVA